MIILFICMSGFSQRKYAKVRKTLFTQNHKIDTLNRHHLTNIDNIEAHLYKNPDHYDAYYDIGMQYFTLASKEMSKESIYWQKSIDAFKKYVENAPKKRKFSGYQNLAVMYGFLNNCEEVQIYVKLRNNDLPKRMESSFKKSADKCIRSSCLEKEG